MPLRLIQVDDLNWPVVVTTFNGQQTDEDVEYCMRRMDAVRARREPFVALSVMREYANNLSHLRRLGTWAKANNKAEVEYCKGSAIVLPSTSARFLISSFFLIVVPPFPMVSFDDLPRRRLVGNAPARRGRSDGSCAAARETHASSLRRRRRGSGNI
jgi:hypothetical protein